MSVIVSQITSITIVYSTVYSGADQRKHESSASLAFVGGIHRGPVNSLHKWPVTRKMFPFDDVIMFYGVGSTWLYWTLSLHVFQSSGSMPARPHVLTSVLTHSDHTFQGIPLFLMMLFRYLSIKMIPVSVFLFFAMLKGYFTEDLWAQNANKLQFVGLSKENLLKQFIRMSPSLIRNHKMKLIKTMWKIPLILGQIWGFQSFSGEQMEVIAKILVWWCPRPERVNV